MDKKLKELTRILYKWNRKKITAGQACYKIWTLYEKECLETWEDPLEALLDYPKRLKEKPHPVSG